MQRRKGVSKPGVVLGPLMLALFVMAFPTTARSGSLNDPEVDRYNVRIGTQTFSGLYHFTTNTLLVETANAIHDMGSDTIKMFLASGYPGKYGITLGPKITNLVTLARDEPSCRHVLDMPFRNYVAWTYPFAYWWPFDGYSASERSSEYKEFYDLTRYFLTNYNNSGKTFYLGHWEGDGYLTGGDWSTNPTPTMVQGFIDCLNNRQKAIDDAKAATGYTNVNVYCYAEANRVRDAMLNGPSSNIRMINAVVPYVTNLDYLSYSSYDAQRLNTANLYSTLDYMEAHLPTNKVSAIAGERIWIGEYGFANAGDSPAAQEPETRAYIQRLLNYGHQAIPFILFWEIYDNETNTDGSYKYFYLIDPNNNKAPCYDLHQRFINNARLAVGRFKETNGRVPNNSEFITLVSPMLDQPLPPLSGMSYSNVLGTLLTPTSGLVSGTFAQGIYGDDFATMGLFWGPQDGGTNRASWEHSLSFGPNTNWNPRTVIATLTNLLSNTNYSFRFYASNATGEVWAPVKTISTIAVNPAAFAYRMKISFNGYYRGEVLANFPVAILLGTNLPGFSYQEFASRTGGDLRLTDSSGLLPIQYEIDEWNTNGTSILWARVPQLSSTNDFIWAYWGNPVATNPPDWTTNGAVWTADHVLVWHLKENGFPYVDSSMQHSAISGVAPVSSAALYGRGSSFNGSSQFLNANAVDLGNAFTLSAWIKIDPSATNIQTLIANKPGGFTSAGFALFVDSYQTADQKVHLETGNGTVGQEATSGANAVSFNQWHLLSAAVDRTAGTAKLYVDGNDVTASGIIRTDFPNQTMLNVGRITNNTLYFKGLMDEVRVEQGIRSQKWIWSAWANAASNSAFVSFSTVNPRPALALNPISTGATIHWSVASGVYQLYTTTNLDPTSVWLPITNPAPILSNGEWQIPIGTNASGNAFYRLQAY